VTASRVIGALVSIAAIVVVTAPVACDPRRSDSFPLSTYPMFASKRDLTQRFEYAVGVTADGERRRIRPRHVAATGEVMDARTTMTDAVSKRRLPDLCARIAGSVARDRRLADVVRIELVRGTHHAIDYLARGVRGPEHLLHRCVVRR
jgi:hypothetical protein